MIPSPPGADVPALLGLAPADGPPHDVVAVEYVYDEDSRKRLESARPEELRDVEPTEPEANSRLSLLRKRQDVGPYLPNLDELGRQLDGDPDGQIAWLLAAFESLARTLPHVSRGEAVAVPTSGNLLVKPPGHADRPPELTGHVLGYRVPRDRVIPPWSEKDRSQT